MQLIYHKPYINRYTKIAKVVLGLITIVVFTYFYYIEYYELENLLLIGPFFGLGLLINGFTGLSLKSIYYDEAGQCIQINRLGLFREKKTIIKKENFKVDLRTVDGKKSIFYNNIKVVFIDGTEDMAEIVASNMWAKKKLKKTYKMLKELEKGALDVSNTSPGFY